LTTCSGPKVARKHFLSLHPRFMMPPLSLLGRLVKGDR